ncbi:hypothetical protein ACFQL0_11080 [Haloplanus litoreus]|uniref:hypothetical protein n=1 Tax=Haloplanus litoreus TaxID=767515 RepID=UPI003612FCF6
MGRDDAAAGDARADEDGRDEVGRQCEPEGRQRQEEAERRGEVTFGHVEWSRSRERPADVVRERPETHEQECAERRKHRHTAAQECGDEAEEAPDDEPQLRLSQSSGVQRRPGPHGDELCHRAGDGETDEADQQQVEVSETREPRRDAEGVGDAQHCTGKQEDQRDDEVPQRDRERGWRSVSRSPGTVDIRGPTPRRPLDLGANMFERRDGDGCSRPACGDQGRTAT